MASGRHPLISATQAFIQHYESNGWSVSIAAEGYLLRKGKSLSRPGCVHGGTTVSVVVVLDGRKLNAYNIQAFSTIDAVERLIAHAY